uniref:Uncharacterized protein n=1 Tax=Ananas comosus var. bracteatus TaxID=296719 RepID=A0A6V7PEU2_ANACO|nr:unnamed protein product [Ananas comosus var. bracteatus]
MPDPMAQVEFTFDAWFSRNKLSSHIGLLAKLDFYGKGLNLPFCSLLLLGATYTIGEALSSWLELVEGENINPSWSLGSLGALKRAFGAQSIGLEPSSRWDWKGSSSHLELERNFLHYRELEGLWAPSFDEMKGFERTWWVSPHQNGINLPYDGCYLS